MTFDKKTYDQEYQKANVTTKRLPFNKNNPDDVALLSWAENQHENFTQYIKRLIRQDKDRHSGSWDIR